MSELAEDTESRPNVPSLRSLALPLWLGGACLSCLYEPNLKALLKEETVRDARSADEGGLGDSERMDAEPSGAIGEVSGASDGSVGDSKVPSATDAPPSDGRTDVQRDTVVAEIMGLPPGLERGLVGFWRLQGSGENAANTIGKGNAVCMRGSEIVAGLWAPGRVGLGATLDGSSTWLQVHEWNGTPTTLDRLGETQQVTAAAWVWFRGDMSGLAFVLERPETGATNPHFGLAVEDGRPAAYVNRYRALGSEALSASGWVHLAMTYDGIRATIWVHGYEAGGSDIGWPLAQDNTPLVMGAGWVGAEVKHFFAGSVDEVALWDRVLSADEMASLARAF